MISNSGVSSILKSSVHGTESTISGGPSILSNHLENRKTQVIVSKGSFESVNSMDISQLNSNKCVVCNKDFSFRKKHFCKFCTNAVCSDHSLKTREKQGHKDPQRICDNCEQEEAKREIKNEINDEVAKLNEELTNAKEINERLNREYFEKTSNLNEVEKKVLIAETEHNKKIESMKEEFEAQKNSAEKTKGLLEILKKTLENTKGSQQDMIEKIEKSQGEIKVLTNKATGLRDKKKEMANEIDLISAKIKQTMPLNDLIGSLCVRCAKKVNESFDKIKNTPYWLDDKEEEKNE